MEKQYSKQFKVDLVVYVRPPSTTGFSTTVEAA
jgi:ethanolamine utilization microcompartment shell protein EutL